MPVGGLLHAVQFARHRPEPIRQASLLMVLASGVSQGDVLATTLRSLASESESPWADQLWQLILLLEQGHTLSRAVSSVRDLLPEESVIAIRIAEDSGTLEATLSGEASRLLSQRDQPAASSLLTSVITCLAVFTVMVSIVTFLVVFIIPKFKAIFMGFDLALPPVTESLVRFSEEFFGVGVIAWLPSVAGIFGLCLMLTKIQIHLLEQGHSSWLDWRARHRSPMVLRMLSLTTATQMPLTDGLRSALAEMEPSRSATQLSRVRKDVSDGMPLVDALLLRGFISGREARFLQSATTSRHVDWGLRHLAASIERRRQLTFERISVVIPPAMILGMGLLVGFVVLSVFLPLVQILLDLG